MMFQGDEGPVTKPKRYGKMDFTMFQMSQWADSLTVDSKSENIAHMLLNFPHEDKTVAKRYINYLVEMPQAPELLTMRDLEGRTPLHAHIESGNLFLDEDTFKLILETSGVDVNAKDDEWETMVHAAAKKPNSLAYLKLLTQCGANINLKNWNGSNALHLSAGTGNLESVEYFVSIGGLMEERNRFGNTPLLSAALFQNVNVVNYLILNGANIFAVDANENNIAHLLLHKQPDDDETFQQSFRKLMSLPHGPKLLQMINVNERTPLHECVVSGMFSPDEITTQFLFKNIRENVNITDESLEEMFLMAARKQGFLASLKCLVQLGVNHNVTSEYQSTALHLSAGQGIMESVEYLVSIGVPIEHRNKFGNTSLLSAALFQRVHVMKFLISQQANVFAVDIHGRNIVHILLVTDNYDKDTLKLCLSYILTLPQAPELLEMKNKEGRTPLREWIMCGFPLLDETLIQLILETSAEDVNTPDSNGETLLLTAVQKPHFLECVNSLVQFGAQYDVTNEYKSNALHLAAGKGILDTVQYLVSIGVCPEERNQFGNTPLLSAALFQKLYIIKFLITKGANLHVKNNAGNNIAHLLLLKKHESEEHFKQCIQYLFSLPQGTELLKMKNSSGRTPLHEICDFEDADSDYDYMTRPDSPLLDATVALIDVFIKNPNAFLSSLFPTERRQEKNTHLIYLHGNNAAHVLLTKKPSDQSTLRKQIVKMLSLPNGSELFNSKNDQGRTPLHELLKSGNMLPELNTIELILALSGEDINATDTNGDSMFLSAAQKHDSLACLKFLKKQGADHRVTNKTGQNALHVSAETGSVDSTKNILSLGVPLEHKDDQGRSPLLVAACFRRVDILEYFVKQKANIFDVDNDGNNIAHLLSYQKRDDQSLFTHSVKYLNSLPQGTRLLKMTNKFGRTPLHEWIKRGNPYPDPEIIELTLKKSRENIDATDIDGNTMFLTAAQRNEYCEGLKCLKKHGANHTIVNNNGHNAYNLNKLYTAKDGSNTEVVNYLTSLGCNSQLS